MMKKISAGFLILISFAVIVAQTDTKPKANWQKFAPNGEEFIVEVPQQMNESCHWKEIDENKFDFSSAEYRNYFNRVFYFIFSTKPIHLPLKTSSFSDVPASLNSFISEFDKESETVKFGEFSGIKYEFEDSEDFYHTIIFINTNNRIYRFHTISERIINDDTKRFWNSLHFFQDVLNPKIYELRNQIVSLNNHGYFNFKEPYTFRYNYPKPVEDSPTTPMKIIHIPLASYTDLARSYGLIGKTVFSVEFMANGEIGKIIPLKRLPFGITKNVENSLKGIKFKPAMKNGSPFTVTKIIENNFTLY